MTLLSALADNNNPSSLANRLRRKRFTMFKSLLAPLPRPLRILDVGGTYHFWQQMGFTGELGIEFVLLNTYQDPVVAKHFRPVVGDATNMSLFADREFDVVFSNSVIEHVGGIDDQMRMANEIRRVGKRYFIQTPNYYFPIEPHFLFPFFQFMPEWTKIWLLQRFKLGWFERASSPAEARRMIHSVRLLTKTSLERLFPDASICHERFCGLTKSLIAMGGWEPIVNISTIRSVDAQSIPHSQRSYPVAK